MTPAAIMLVIGILVPSPYGLAFIAQERVPAASVEDCWKMAVYITTDPRTKQIAMCVPGKDTSDEATKNKRGVSEGSEDR